MRNAALKKKREDDREMLNKLKEEQAETDSSKQDKVTKVLSKSFVYVPNFTKSEY